MRVFGIKAIIIFPITIIKGCSLAVKFCIDMTRVIEDMEVMSGFSQTELYQMKKSAQKISIETPKSFEECFREEIRKRKK